MRQASDETDSAPPAALPTRILERISTEPAKVWTTGDFAEVGSRDGFDNALQRLAKSGDLRRIERGLYDKPRLNKLTGKASARSTDWQSVDAVTQAGDALRITCGGDALEFPFDGGVWRFADR